MDTFAILRYLGRDFFALGNYRMIFTIVPSNIFYFSHFTLFFLLHQFSEKSSKHYIHIDFDKEEVFPFGKVM